MHWVERYAFFCARINVFKVVSFSGFSLGDRRITPPPSYALYKWVAVIGNQKSKTVAESLGSGESAQAEEQRFYRVVHGVALDDWVPDFHGTGAEGDTASERFEVVILLLGLRGARDFVIFIVAVLQISA